MVAMPMSIAAPPAPPANATCPAVSVFTAFFVAASARADRADRAETLARRRALHDPADDDEDFDFVIVGGGSAGCVLANRLSEVAQWRVLLLEAGAPEPELTQPPAIYRNMQLTDMNWRYRSEPQAGHCNGTGCPSPMGKVLGGSSALNGFVYIRGSPRDYDEWAAVLRDDTWSYAEVLPYFRRSENVLEDDLAADTVHHAKGGPLPVQRLPNVDPINGVLLQAMQDMGLKEGDPNGATQTGYSLAQTTTMNGERASANRAFLTPVRGRSNLVVRTRAHVARVLFQRRKAMGVEYRDGYSGNMTRAWARKEVVLSAGVVNTPQILMLSGIGPKPHLSSMGIEVLQDLREVGENMMNHVTSLGVEYFLPEDWPGHPADIETRVDHYIDFTPGGPLSSVGPEEVNAFFKLPDDVPRRNVGLPGVEDRPEINLRFYGNIPKALSVGDPDCDPAPPQDPLFYDRVLVTPVVLPCRSVGRVRLRNADPFSAPRIFLNLLGDPDGADLALLVRGLRLAASLEDTPAFRAAGLVLNREPLPGCGHHEFGGDLYWACVARGYTLNAHHAAGTCRMARHPVMAKARAPGVLDSKLRVRGVTHLRVVDASAMPLLPNGNPNAPIIMLAEKGAALIRRDWAA